MGNVITDPAGNCVWCKLEKASCDIDPNACLICKVGGKLLCCEGKECRRSFHLSCLDPPLDDVPLGVWHCPMCIRRKIKFGVHAVSKGVESVWDTRETEISNADGLQRQKQYFVKFKDLAHAHNCWLPESELPLEASSLISRFNKRNQHSRWKQVWAVPQRLLQKRLLFSSKLCEEHDREVSGAELNCQYEWLVKWRGLDYKCATWELESASFLSSSDGQGLMEDYERRCEKAKFASHVSEMDEILERKRTTVVNLSQFTDRDTCGFNDNYVNYVTKLCEFWHEAKNAVVIDNQDRMVKVIAFILTLRPDVLRPFLIISTSTALGSWDDQLLRYAPSFSAVVYKGNKNVRKNIRDLEFYQGNRPLFQALICSPEVMMEDLDVLDCINWEVIVVDECQRPTISSHFEKMKFLNADMWLLVLADQLKDIKDDYHNLLSLLEGNNQVQSDNTLKTNDGDNISKLKERLLYHTAYTCTSKFVEYWVPARISNVQLELYCATLLSNAGLLVSSFKSDLLDNIHEMLVSTRKCCNHPYILEPSMGHVITKGHPEVDYLDIGIKASGKLQLLDAMLREMKKKGSRVLILFQSICGSGRDTIGDILDDFLRQRFGIDSYERIDGGLIYSKKQAALNKFNNLESGRFLFLLEVRACLPSIKLSSVDSIIIYDSDWTPMNDLRALQRITLDSQLEQIKIFRLYSSCTVEEKVLMLSLQNKTLEGNLQNISWSCANMLLMWGASNLFADLDKFLDKDKTADSLSDTAFLEEVVNDLVLLISQNARSTDEFDSHVILKVQQIEGVYCAHSPILGQSKMPSTEEQPLIFWSKLLDGKHPKWKYSSDRSLRNRKRVQQCDDSSCKSKSEIEESLRKRKKVSNSNVKVAQDEYLTNKEKEDTSEAPKHTCQNSTSLAACEDDSYIENHLSKSSLTANDISKILDYKSVGFDAVRKLIDLRKSLHHLLKPEISQLCQILKFPEHVERGVEKFFEYIMNNHHIITEPATTTLLQAFQLSLCWTAASMLEYKIDHKESLALAKKYLNFDCHRQEVYLLYSRLRCLKKIFFKHLEYYKVPESSLASESPYNVLSDNEFQKAVVTSINRIQKTCRKKFEKLKQKQQEERDEFDGTCDDEKSQMERQFQMESAVIRSCFHNSLLTRNSKLQILENEYLKQLEEYKCQMEIRCKKLEEEHNDETNKMIEMEAHWVDTLTSWLQVELLSKQILNKTKQSQNSLPVTEIFHGLGVDATVCDHLPEESKSDALHNVSGTGKGISEIPRSVSCEAIICSNAVEKCSLQTIKNGETAALDTMGSQGPSATEFDNHNRITSSNGIERNLTSEDPSYVGKEPEGVILSNLDKEISTDGSNHRCSVGAVDVASVHLPTSEEQISHSDKEAPQKLIEVVDLIEGSQRVLTVPLLPFAEGGGNGAIRNPGNEDPSGTCSLRNSDSFVDAYTDPETSPCGLNLPIREVERVPESVNLVDVRENISASQSASQELIPTSEIERLRETVNLVDVRENISASQSASQELIPIKSMVRTSEIDISSAMNASASCEALEVDCSNSENDGEDLSEPVNPCVIEDTIGNADPDVHALELSVTSSPLELAVTPTAQGNCSLLFNQAAHDEINQESSSTGFMDGIIQATEIANTNGDSEAPTSYVADQYGQEEHEEMNLQSPCTGSIDDIMQANAMVNTNGDTEAPISYVANQSIQGPQTIEPQTPMVPLATNSSVGLSQTDLSSVGGTENQMNRENHSFYQLAQTTNQPIEIPVQSIDEVLLQPVTCTAPHSTPNVAFSETRMSFLDTRILSANFDISNGLMQTTQPSVSQTPSLLHIDPLEKELEKLRKEIDINMDMHTKRKLHLKSECEKEIEEVTAQIQKKYETKLQESETEFDLRKKDLDVNYSKVLMNKILAEAFRWKYNDSRTCDSGPSLAPLMLQPLHLQNLPGPSLVVRPSFTPAIVSSHTFNAPSINLQRMATAANLSTNLPSSSPSTASTSMHVHHTSTHFSSSPMRPPYIGSISSPTGNPQVGSVIRAPAPHLQPFRPTPAPHLQPFRPTSSISAANPRGISTQHGPSNPSTIPPSFPQRPPRPSVAAPHQSIPLNRSYRPDSLEQLPTFSNTALSALDLLMDMNNRAGVNFPQNFPPPAADVTLTAPQPVPPVSTGSTQVNAVNTTGDSDVVYLSDDD
ncbi:helicase protein MOM1 isoform X2 [Cucurbita moschata]|uniref:Helicase protein MOM1 isoform X2 n=3 Tax=Cucurbita TaxID=3660 RepID=A0A6J1GC13_CUCMO|nr:helicase protein MOM1 isoform X2 [Cucurbita moschata]